MSLFFYLEEGGKNVDRIDVVLKVFIATFGGFCGYFLGGWDTTLQILVTLAVIDYVTGMIAASILGQLKSKIGFKGIAKKVVLFYWLEQLRRQMRQLVVIVRFVKRHFFLHG